MIAILNEVNFANLIYLDRIKPYQAGRSHFHTCPTCLVCILFGEEIACESRYNVLHCQQWHPGEYRAGLFHNSL